MQSLELKIPPPAVMLLTALAMWAISRVAPLIAMPALPRKYLAAALALVSVSVAIAGVVAIRRAHTTINPHTPSGTTTLVRTGVYAITRNPMYLGLTFVLLTWAAFLSCAWALLGPLVFVLYINCFQIIPEERALATLFGDAYASYKQKVRRWL